MLKREINEYTIALDPNDEFAALEFAAMMVDLHSNDSIDGLTWEPDGNNYTVTIERIHVP